MRSFRPCLTPRLRALGGVMVITTYIGARVVQVRQRVKRKTDRIITTGKKLSLTRTCWVCRILYKKRRAGKWPARSGCQGDRSEVLERRRFGVLWRRSGLSGLPARSSPGSPVLGDRASVGRLWSGCWRSPAERAGWRSEKRLPSIHEGFTPLKLHAVAGVRRRNPAIYETTRASLCPLASMQGFEPVGSSSPFGVSRSVSRDSNCRPAIAARTKCEHRTAAQRGAKRSFRGAAQPARRLSAPLPASLTRAAGVSFAGGRRVVRRLEGPPGNANGRTCHISSPARP